MVNHTSATLFAFTKLSKLSLILIFFLYYWVYAVHGYIAMFDFNQVFVS